MKTRFLLLLLFLSGYCCAQLSDDFTDGNFTANPSWTGTSSDFIVNSSHFLQISNTVGATSYLSVPHGLTTLDGQEWHLWVKQTFAPSASNYGRIYLTAASPDLSTNPDGFVLQLGEAGALDAIRLFRSVGGTTTEICSGTSGQIAASFAIGLRVVRDHAGVWTLFVDPLGGTAYLPEGSGVDTTHLLGTHFGVLGTYTVSNATKFYFDDIYAGPEIIDTQAPGIVSATTISGTQIDLLFDEDVTGPALLSAGDYTLNPAVGVQSAAIDGADASLVHLLLADSMQNGQSYQLTVASASDPAGNAASNLATNFTYLVSDPPVKGDLIITELFSDPTPALGLPEVEFIELYNRSNKYFDLADWKIGDASADGTITGGWIMPGEYKVLCSTASLADYPNGFAVTSFPSLNNSGDDVVLKAPSLAVIDKVAYTDSWYRDDAKKDGGYTLELINPNDPCSDQLNWTASMSSSGGTPAQQNSVYDPTPDTEAPTIIATNAVAPNQLELTFSEGMDSVSLAGAVLTVNPGLTVAGYSLPSAFPGTMTVLFNENITASQLYAFTIGPVADCWLNATHPAGTFALAEAPAAGDLVINEILFDPGTGGTDFIELYNRSQKILDLQTYGIANFDDGALANIHTIPEHYLLFPDQYIVLTADSAYQQAHFPAAIPGRFYQMSLPALDNDSSTIYVLYDSIVVDRVAYKESWHLSLLDNTENKTLERIDPNGVASFSGNWHTAAETIGFGTPGGQNSQYEAGGVNGAFGTIQPIFSPDNDGFEDVLLFFYEMPQPGMIATLKIFDDQGRIIREVFGSELLGINGNVSWDGITDNHVKAGLGIYLAVMEAFSPDGSANYSKRVAFTLGGKLD